MNCTNCGGRLEGNLTICPFCDTRQDIDLRQAHFRNLGTQGNLPCPGCESLLEVIEFETDPPIQVERCQSCYGLFFNPGEIEALLEAKITKAVWVDGQRLGEIGRNFGHNHEVIYRKCPMCAERMSHINFGGRSGVIMDRCGTHGFWLEGGELRRLMEWWRAGGKHIHQEHEQEKVRRRSVEMRSSPMSGSGAFGDSSTDMEPLWGNATGDSKWDTVIKVGAVLAGIASILMD